MKVKLKRYWKTKYETEAPFILEEDDNFAFYFHFEVSSDTEEEKTCLFKVLFCTPQWILENKKNCEVVSLRHKLIVFEYNFPEMIDYIVNYLSRINETTWDESVKKIERIAEKE